MVAREAVDELKVLINQEQFVCGEGLLQQMMGSPPSLCSLWEMDILQ